MARKMGLLQTREFVSVTFENFQKCDLSETTLFEGVDFRRKAGTAISGANEVDDRG